MTTRDFNLLTVGRFLVLASLVVGLMGVNGPAGLSQIREGVGVIEVQVMLR